MLHFAAYIPDIGLYQEYKKGVEKYGGWFDSPPEIKNGAFTVPQGPGVGIRNIGDLLKGAELVKSLS